MTDQVQAAESQVESLRVARGKLAKAVEIFAPLGVTRENSLNMIGLALIEFEAAVREDERAKTGDAVATAQAAALDAEASAHGNRVAAEAALRGVAEAQNVAPTESAAPSAPPPVAPTAPEVTDAAAPTSRKRK